MRDKSLWLTVSEVARRIGAPEETVREWAKTGTGPLPFHPFGGDRRAWHVDVDLFLTEGTRQDVTLSAMVEAGVLRALLYALDDCMIRRDLRWERKAS